MHMYTHKHMTVARISCADIAYCIHTPDTPLVSCKQVPCKSRALVAKIGLLCTRDMKFKGPNPRTRLHRAFSVQTLHALP